MHCKIYYSKEADFANAVNIADFSGSMKANDMMEVKATPVIELSEGETLRLRVYPWYGSAATGKTICLSDVKVAGVAVSATNGVKSVESSELKPEKVYYSLDGIRQNGILDGLNIVVENGVARKIMK